MKIALISSSVREDRLSHRAALLLSDKFSALGHSVSIIDLKEIDFPPLDYVLDRHPNPNPDYIKVRAEIREAEALIFISPEYNGSYTAALKNLVDHLGKPDFAKKVIGISSPTSGPMGGMRGALAMQELVLAIWAYPIPQMLLIPEIQKKIGAHGELIDPNFERTVNNFVAEFVWTAEAIVDKKMAELARN